MTVSTSYAPLTYTGNGVTTSFAVTWPFFTGSLIVTSISSTGVETVKTSGTDYTVSGGTTKSGLPNTGTVVMKTAAIPPAGTQLRITRSTPVTQVTTWGENDAFPQAVVEAALDKNVMIAQEFAATDWTGPEGDPGPEWVNWIGAWSAGTYNEGDGVSHNGSSYRANATTSQEPPHADWDLIASKGADIILDIWALQPIGVPIPVFADLFDDVEDALPSAVSSHYTYIVLTAGLTGSGDYNEGKLTSESVSGSSPLVIATAEIDFPTSPLDGKTVHLINTEGRYIIAGETAGVVRNDQMQQITGTFPPNIGGASSGAAGAISQVAGISIRENGAFGTVNLTFDSANSPNARAGSDTHGKDISAVFIMRIA